jgi:transposase
VIRGMLGEDFDGVVVVDRWSAYVRLRRAYCWAHMLRDFTAMAERHHSQWHGRRLEQCARQVMDLWARWRDGEITRADLLQRMGPVRERTERLLAWTSANAPGAKARSVAGEILRHSDCLWRFLDDELIAPTNNHGERLIRPSVIVRQLTFGNDTDNGALSTSRILTSVSSLRLQDRNAFDYLAEAIISHAEGRPQPSLLPDHASVT